MKDEECYNLLRKTVFFMSPNQQDRCTLLEGEVVGFINQRFLHQIKNIQYFQNQTYDKHYHDEIFNQIGNDISYEYDYLVK